MDDDECVTEVYFGLFLRYVHSRLYILYDVIFFVSFLV